MVVMTGSLGEGIDNRRLTEGMVVNAEPKVWRWLVELPVTGPSDPRLPLLKLAQIRSRDCSAFSAAIMPLSWGGGDLEREGPRAGDTLSDSSD